MSIFNIRWEVGNNYVAWVYDLLTKSSNVIWMGKITQSYVQYLTSISRRTTN